MISVFATPIMFHRKCSLKQCFNRISCDLVQACIQVQWTVAKLFWWGNWKYVDEMWIVVETL